jgi:hypothetical protein
MPLFDVQISDTVALNEALSTMLDRRLSTDSISVADSIVVNSIPSLTIADARPVSPTRIRIDFSENVVDSLALRDPASYSFTPLSAGAAILYPQAVRLPVAQANPLYVEVDVTEMTDGASYQVILTGAMVGISNGTPSSSPFNFTGEGDTPTLYLVLATAKNKVQVTFSERMLDNLDIRDLSNYSFDKGLDILSIDGVMGSVVFLTTSDQVAGELYTLTVLGASGPAQTNVTITDNVSVSDSIVVDAGYILTQAGITVTQAAVAMTQTP